jgi:haloacetate dehalogenase
MPVAKAGATVGRPTHLQSEQTEEGRRGLFKTLAAGAAAASAATPSLAQQSTVLAEATSADYVRDPTRWGSAELAALFPNFKHLDIRTKGAVIRVRHGGSGPPLLLLHGNSQNHATWYGVAARLAEHYHVVLADLRGYGDSSLCAISVAKSVARVCGGIAPRQSSSPIGFSRTSAAAVMSG